MRTIQLCLAALILTGAASAPARPDHGPVFVTLGTNAGPIPDPERGEPANLLQTGSASILIDAGDGVSERLGKAGVALVAVDTLFISHLHFDHTGGLFALLGQRYQTIATRPLTIYGPPGTKRTVAGLIAAMGPITDPGTNLRARSPLAPDAAVQVIELADGDKVTLGELTVTVARNTHYDNGGGGWENRDTASYAYRFDMPGRSIVYTGDTGPSPSVEALARGADLLVAEVMDPDEAIATLHRSRPDLPAAALQMVERHHRLQHLSPHEAGLMAARAGVHALVLTHIGISDAGLAKARREIRAAYHGPVTFARDGQRF